MMKGSPIIFIDIVNVRTVPKELVGPDGLSFRSRLKESAISGLLSQIIV